MLSSGYKFFLANNTCLPQLDSLLLIFQPTFTKIPVLKHRAGFVILALAAGLASRASNVNAFTLGYLQGVAVVGRALDVSVRVQSSPAEELTAACFTAEVFHAETRQGAPLVSILSTATGDTLVRIQSAALVDEPVVSLDVRSRCGSATTRRYVLLADIAPANTPLPMVHPLLVVAPVVLAPSKTDTTTTRQSPAASAVTASQTPNGQPKLKPRKQAAKNVARTPKRANPAVGRTGSKAVLKLDPLDLFSDRIAALDASMLFEPTADALQQAHKVADLQNDVKLLRDLAVKNDAQLLDLKAQLQLAQSQQISPAWFYALCGAALAGLMALAWLVWQYRQDKQASAQTWHDSLQSPVGAAPVHPTASTPATSPSEPTPPKAPVPLRSPEPEPPVPIDPQWYAETAQPTMPSASPASGIASLHSLSVEPILDIRQQAEFFVSLGQTDRALHILVQQIASSNEPNPLIYLDLLALLHSLGMKAEFRQYRHDFNQHFSGAIPDFAAFHLEGRDLLDYPDVLERLTQDWPSAKTLILLDTWIFRNARAATHVSFDLAAFRDLLMLHALAEEVAVDLAWDTASQPRQPNLNTAAKSDEVAPAANLARAAQTPASPDINAQVLDMDFSMFDSGTFDPDSRTDTQPTAEPSVPPRADAARARWPAKDRP
jgi:hypothetical protein